MAISYVGGQTASITASTATNTDITFSLSGGSASTPAAGDFVVIAYSIGSTVARVPAVNTAGYTQLTQLNAADTFDANLRVAYKRMGGTPDTTVQVGPTLATTDAGFVTIHVFRGVDPTTPLDVTHTTATAANSGTPNPPAITPANANNVIYVVGSNGHGTTGTMTASYATAFLTGQNITPTNKTTMGAGYVTGQSAGVSYDPAVFTWSANVNTQGWCAYTLAIREEITVVNQTLTPGVGSVSVAGAAATFAAGFAASPTTSDASYAGLALENAGPLPLGSYSAGTYGTGAYNASTVSQTVAVGVGSVTVAGLAATFAAGFTATPAQGTVAVTGVAPTVAGSAVAASSLGTVAILGRAATLAASSTAATGVGAVTVTGLAPTVTGSVSASTTTGTVTVTGLAPSVVAGASITTSLGAVTVDGFAPDVVSGGGTLTMETFAGEISLAGYEVTLTGVWVSESAQSELWTEQAEQSETWTPQGNQSEAWAGQSAQSETWTPQSADPWS